MSSLSDTFLDSSQFTSLGDPGCAVQLINMIERVEAGDRPWPILFQSADCSPDIPLQWPRRYENLSSMDYDVPISYDRVCTTAGDGVLDADNCPLPFIQTMIIPESMAVTFYAATHSYSPNARQQYAAQGIDISKYSYVPHVHEFGQKTLTYAQTNNTGILRIPLVWETAKSQGFTWGSAVTETDTCQDSVIDGFDPSTYFHPTTHKMMKSSVSCGEVMWPILTPLHDLMATDQQLIYKDNRFQWVQPRGDWNASPTDCYDQFPYRWFSKYANDLGYFGCNQISYGKFSNRRYASDDEQSQRFSAACIRPSWSVNRQPLVDGAFNEIYYYNTEYMGSLMLTRISPNQFLPKGTSTADTWRLSRNVTTDPLLSLQTGGGATRGGMSAKAFGNPSWEAASNQHVFHTQDIVFNNTLPKTGDFSRISFSYESLFRGHYYTDYVTSTKWYAQESQLCTQDEDYWNYWRWNPMAGPNAVNVSHNVDYIKFHGSEPYAWQKNIARACTGQQSMKLGGVDIQRYRQGSPACDVIMEELCLNSAILSEASELLTACACIQQRNQVLALFTGLDVPVSCFLHTCSNGSNLVYKGSDQGTCSATLCKQTLQVNGSDILLSGYQTMICNGTSYDVSTAEPLTGEVLDPALLANPSTVDMDVLGSVKDTTLQQLAQVPVTMPMFVALALIGLAVILFVLWFVFRFAASFHIASMGLASSSVSS